MGTYTNLTYHVVFSTKYRAKTIESDFRDRLYHYVGGIVRGQKGHLIEIGGVEDHVHLLSNLSPVHAVSDAIRNIKANASKWINELPESDGKFRWQKGYGAFSVSYSQIELVEKYIQNQQEHHRTRSFREEYIAMLQRHNIPFDPKYLFDDEHHG